MNYCDDQYELAGELVEEECHEISRSRYSDILNDEVDTLLDQVLLEHPLPFDQQDFQILALHALGSLKNVILVSPTG